MRDDTFPRFVLEQLAPLGGVTSRRMFGGHGLYADGSFFGLIHNNRLFFKTDAASANDYLAAGSKPFQPSARQTLKHYYEVPAAVLDRAELLIGWARRAIQVTNSIRR